MGGTSCDVCVIEDGAARETGGAPGRRAARGAADARPAHRRRGRRLDRLARRGRRAARRPALGRRAPRAGRATGTAAPSRRSPTPTSCSGCSAATRRSRARSRWTRTPARAAVQRLADELGLVAARDRRGDPPRRQRGDGPRAARDDRRARRRPARARAARVRRRRAAARRGDRRRAGDDARSSARARPACSPRSASSSRSGGATPSAACCCRGDALTAAARCATEIAALGRRAATLRVDRRAALPRPGVRAGGASAARSPTRTSCARRSPPPTSSAYGYRDPDGEVELVTLRVTPPSRAGDRRGRRGRRRPRRDALDPARDLRRRGARGDGAHRRARARHGARRARRSASCPRRRSRPARLVAARVEPSGDDPAATADEPSTRSPCRVVSGALRAACEEMGAVLIRAAHSANIKERRDASCALFDPDGRMVMQAEHIPVHLGAMPAAVEAVVGERRTRPASPGCSTTPTAAARTCRTSPSSRRRSPTTARCSASPPTARTTPTSAARRPARCPPTRTTLAEEGVVIPPRRLDEAAIDELVAADAPARASAAPTCARSSPPTAPGVERLRELHARGGLARGDGGDDRLRRAAHARLPRRAARRHAPRRRDVLEAREGDLELRARRDGARRRADARLHRLGAAARRQPQLPARRSRARRAGSPCACSPTPTSRRPPAPTARSRVIAPEGSLLNARPPAAVVAGNVETSSRVADLVLAAFGRALGQGTMNNLTLGSDAFTYYETLGGGQGACADADGPERRARRDVQHAQHAGRGARARVPAARDALRAAARLGRRGRAARRRRRRARARGARADDASRCSPSAAATRRPAPTAAGRARAGATCSTARSSRRRRAVACGPVSDCGSRRRRWRIWLSPWGSSDWGSWARGWRRTSRAPGIDGRASTTAPPRRRRRGSPSTAAASPRRRARRPRAPRR